MSPAVSSRGSKNYNNTALAVDQLGVRSGAAAVYLDVWHKDIMDFLNLKTNNGDDRMKAHDIFPGVCIPDLFMRKVRERGVWHLFDPHEARSVKGYSIEDSWGDEFERRYEECVEDPSLSKDEIPAIDIMKKIMSSAFETGSPFLFFRDTVNRDNPNKHAGMIYCSNLCTEICQNMSPTELIQSVHEDGIITTKIKKRRLRRMQSLLDKSRADLDQRGYSAGRTHSDADDGQCHRSQLLPDPAGGNYE